MKNRKCEDCIAYCSSCSDTSTCDECTYPYILNENRLCRDKCKLFEVEINGECKNCTVSNCMICEKDLKTCKVCDYGYFLNVDGNCVKECELGYYANYFTRKCVKCHNTCGSCKGGYIPCESCVANLVFYQGYCYETCPNGTVKIGGKCEACKAKNCKRCNPDNLNECPECYPEFVLDDNVCVPNCPSNKLNVNGKCVICTDHCLYCLPNKECDLCEKGYYKYKGKCLPNCETGTVAYYEKCIDCTNSRCKTCLPYNPTKCTSCKDNLVLINYDCEEEKCPEGYYKGLNNKCYECSNGCNKCTSFTNCIQCSKGLKLIKTDEGIYCVKDDINCPEGTTSINGECYPCIVNNCKICNSPTTSICPECKKIISFIITYVLKIVLKDIMDMIKDATHVHQIAKLVT